MAKPKKPTHAKAKTTTPGARARSTARARPPSARASAKSPARRIELEVVAPLRAARASADPKLDALLARIAELRGRGAEAFDALYEAVADGYDGEPPLYRSGYATEDAYLAAALPEVDVRTAKRNLLIAVAFSPEDEQHHTVRFLEAAALYAKQKQGIAGFPRAIDLDRLRVEVKRDRARVLLAARRATEQELVAAREALAGTRRRARRSPVRDAVQARLAKTAALRGIIVGGGDESLSFRAVPASSLRAFGRALASLPAPKASASKSSTSRPGR